MILEGIKQALTMRGDPGPVGGGDDPARGRLGVVDDAAIIVDAGVFQWCGPRLDLPTDRGAGHARVDLGGAVVTPGWVECHTHVVYGGDRLADFERRARGMSYEAIARLGGGIQTTVDATRAASTDELVAAALPRLARLARHGVTTVEIKSGYGLSVQAELRLLEVIRRLAEASPLRIVATLLGAHVVPREHRADRERYVRLVTEELIPEAASRGLARFCDVFVEQGAFFVDEARRILARARDEGLGLKVHAEQLSRTGAARLAAELGATSADHLEEIDAGDARALADAGTVPVLLPAATLFLGKTRYAPGRLLADAGALPALSTDLNPGSAHTAHMPLMTTLGCTQCGLTPAEALLAVTRRAADALALGDAAGVIVPGASADLAVLDVPSWEWIPYELGANPVRRVMRAGVWLP